MEVLVCFRSEAGFELCNGSDLRLAQPTDWETIRKLLESRADQANATLWLSGLGYAMNLFAVQLAS